jgi:uncharacterized membrane protein HdeD (DUF308 family)
VKDLESTLSRWPLLVTGLTVIALGLGLFVDGDDKSDALALLLGVGCVLVGAGIVRVVEHDDHDRTRDDAADDPAP